MAAPLTGPSIRRDVSCAHAVAAAAQHPHVTQSLHSYECLGAGSNCAGLLGCSALLQHVLLRLSLCTGAVLRAPGAAAVAQHVRDLAADLLRLQQLRRLVIVVHVPRILLPRARCGAPEQECQVSQPGMSSQSARNVKSVNISTHGSSSSCTHYASWRSGPDIGHLHSCTVRIMLRVARHNAHS